MDHMNFWIGMSPILLAMIGCIFVLVRGIAEDYGYKFFILPVAGGGLVCSWIWYWLIYA